MKAIALGCLLTVTLACGSFANSPSIHGDYLEVRTCDVYTGSCFANAEMGLSGKEAILVWSVREGTWNSTRVDGLKVIAVVRTDATLGDQRYQPRSGDAVIILDDKADAKQREALTDLAKSMAGKLVRDVVEVKTAGIDANISSCTKAGCANVKAGNLVEIATRCFGEQDHVCGNEETYYPPLTKVNGAMAAFTEVASFKGSGLEMTWQAAGQRSAFLAAFAQ